MTSGDNWANIQSCLWCQSGNSYKNCLIRTPENITIWLFNSSPWKIPINKGINGKMGKSSISIGHLFHGYYVSHNQTVEAQGHHRQFESPCEDVSHFTKRRPLPPALMKPRPPAGRGKWATSKSTTDIFPIKTYDVQRPFGGYTGIIHYFQTDPYLFQHFACSNISVMFTLNVYNGMIHDISIFWWSYNRVTCLKCLDSVRLKIEVGMQHHLPSGYLT